MWCIMYECVAVPQTRQTVSSLRQEKEDNQNFLPQPSGQSRVSATVELLRVKDRLIDLEKNVSRDKAKANVSVPLLLS